MGAPISADIFVHICQRLFGINTAKNDETFQLVANTQFLFCLGGDARIKYYIANWMLGQDRLAGLPL